MGQFICGECLEEMKKMPDESIDFIFTSPPYADQIKDYGATGVKIKPDQFDNWFIQSDEEYKDFMSNSKKKVCLALMKNIYHDEDNFR